MFEDDFTATGPRLAWRWMTRIGQGAAAMMLLAGASAATTATAAQEICGARADLLEELTKRYHEAPAAVGLANSGVLVEVLTADNGSTWTIIVSQPNGTSCLVAAGKEWQELKRTASRDLRV